MSGLGCGACGVCRNFGDTTTVEYNYNDATTVEYNYNDATTVVASLVLKHRILQAAHARDQGSPRQRLFLGL